MLLFNVWRHTLSKEAIAESIYSSTVYRQSKDLVLFDKSLAHPVMPIEDFTVWLLAQAGLLSIQMPFLLRKMLVGLCPIPFILHRSDAGCAFFQNASIDIGWSQFDQMTDAPADKITVTLQITVLTVGRTENFCVSSPDRGFLTNHKFVRQ